MLVKRLFALFLFVVYISFLLAGCTININVGNSSEEATNRTNGKTIFDHIFNNRSTMYESRATIYISNIFAESSAISSSDLTVSKQLAESYQVILNSKKIKSKIQEQYPNIEYKLTMESINQTEVFYITATSEKPEELDDVCNLAASLLCEEVPLAIEGASCKVVECARSAQLVGTN